MYEIFQKLFLWRERGCGPEDAEQWCQEVAKHRTSLGKSTDVLHQKYGCLPQRSPMFLFSGKGAVKAGSRERGGVRHSC